MAQEIDRLPLVGQAIRNFSGHTAEQQKSWVWTEWWTNSPTTGVVSEWKERNDNFHINQGPVDLGITGLRNWAAQSGIDPSSKLGTILPRNHTLDGGVPQWPLVKDCVKSKLRHFVEVYIWHPFDTPSTTEFSTIPTKY